VLTKLNRQQVTTSNVVIPPQKRRENFRMIHKQISTTYLPVVAELAKTSIKVGELLALEPGDIIKLDKRINEEIEILINGKRKLAGRPGSVEGKKAVRITRALKEEDLIEQDLRYKPEE